ncbi:putative F-box protein At1g33530 [Papaver somniferum]|uniref:putative F-box protein At1g33530 n=1 Tax=Papaver somniferum TaxID=3469 RepID=UPI000E6F4F4A|nr:putative F-box protein At1g33530 [Papaver somniferum]
MNVIVPCMRWVPICWRDLLGFFYKNNEGVDDPLSDISTINNSPPTVIESVCDPLIEDDPLHILVPDDNPLNKLYVDLPDSIVEDILSRLPAKCIFQCQLLSKALHALTKTSNFTQMQLNRSNSVTVVQRFPDFDSEYGFIKLYFIDEEYHNIETKTLDLPSSYKRKDNRISIVGSHDGILLFTNFYPWEEPVCYYLWNPVTNEKLTWCLAFRVISYVCGFYFCSLRREYVLLLVYKVGARYEFKVLTIKTEARKDVGSFSYPPSRGRPPVIINKTLYWMVDQVLYKRVHGDWPCYSHLIVSFEMETEKFIALAHSGRIGKSVYENMSLHLFELEGALCICDPISSTELELSVLNHKTKCWVKRHTVILPMCGIDKFSEFWRNKNDTEAICYKKSELLVRQKNRLYAYNLHSGTYRIVEMGFVDHPFQATMHVNSLVPLLTIG